MLGLRSTGAAATPPSTAPTHAVFNGKCLPSTLYAHGQEKKQPPLESAHNHARAQPKSDSQPETSKAPTPENPNAQSEDVKTAEVP